MLRFLACLGSCFAFPLVLAAVPLASSQPADPGWQKVLGEFLKSEKFGFGGLCGVVVDHANGDVLINMSDKGIYRSTDQAKSFQRVNAKDIQGRTEWPACMQLDPTGKTKRLLLPLVYGAPLSTSVDFGKTLKPMHGDSKHVDWAAIDWNDPDNSFVLTVKHEVEGLMLASNDGGKTFREVGKGFGTGYVFDAKTAVVSQAVHRGKVKSGLLRTTDGGKTWQPSGDYIARPMPRFHGDSLYWLTDNALIASSDQGKTWKKISDLKGGRCGPIFGKDDKHLFVLNAAGIVESKDHGATWSTPIAVPKGMTGITSLVWIDYDPRNDVLYVMMMGSDLYKLSRKQ